MLRNLHTMADIVLFHHAQGQTPGFHAFADTLRKAGHAVHTPDLFDGRTFSSIPEGLAYADSIGFDAFQQRVDSLVSELPEDACHELLASWMVSGTLAYPLDVKGDGFAVERLPAIEEPCDRERRMHTGV